MERGMLHQAWFKCQVPALHIAIMETLQREVIEVTSLSLLSLQVPLSGSWCPKQMVELQSLCAFPLPALYHSSQQGHRQKAPP